MKRRNLFSLHHIKDSFSAIFKKREHNKRFFLIIYLTIMLTKFLPWFGESVVNYSYVRTRYDWTLTDYSNYYSVCTTMDIIGQVFLIPLMAYLAIADTRVVPAIIMLTVVRHCLKGLSYQPWLMYMASAIDTMGGYSTSAIRSAASKCVNMDELGKVGV